MNIGKKHLSFYHFLSYIRSNPFQLRKIRQSKLILSVWYNGRVLICFLPTKKNIIHSKMMLKRSKWLSRASFAFHFSGVCTSHWLQNPLIISAKWSLNSANATSWLYRILLRRLKQESETNIGAKVRTISKIFGSPFVNIRWNRKCYNADTNSSVIRYVQLKKTLRLPINHWRLSCKRVDNRVCGYHFACAQNDGNSTPAIVLALLLARNTRIIWNQSLRYHTLTYIYKKNLRQYLSLIPNTCRCRRVYMHACPAALKCAYAVRSKLKNVALV